MCEMQEMKKSQVCNVKRFLYILEHNTYRS